MIFLMFYLKVRFKITKCILFNKRYKDQEIVDSFVGNATNAQLAQSTTNLLEKYPNLK